MQRPPLKPAFVLAAVYLLLLLVTLHFPPIGSSSEAREGQVIAVMLRSGEFILPLRNGIIPSKPPLYHWSGLPAAFLLGGVTPFVARMPAAVYGALVLLLTVMLASAWAGSGDAQKNTRAGLAAGALLSLTYGFTSMALQARVDMALAFFTVLALYCALRGLNKDREAGRVFITGLDINLCFAACAFAVLAKGPLGLVLPMLIIFTVLVFEHGVRAALLFMARPRLGWLLFLLIALPWYILAYRYGSQAFLARQVFTENLSRFFGNPGGEFQPPWFYIPHLLRAAFPWSLFFLAALALELRDRTRAPGRRDPIARAKRAALIWFTAGFLLFSASSGKRASYLLPLYPAVCVWLALHWQQHEPRWLAAARFRRAAVAVLSAAFGLALLLALAAGLLPPPADPVLGLALAAYRSVALPAALLALLGAALLALRQQRALYLAAVLALVLARQTGDTVKESLRQFEPYSRDIAALVPPQADFAVIKDALDEHFDPLFFYWNREVRIVPPESSDVPCPAYLLCRSAVCAALPQAPGTAWNAVKAYNTASDAARGRTDREIVLKRCSRSL